MFSKLIKSPGGKFPGNFYMIGKGIHLWKSLENFGRSRIYVFREKRLKHLQMQWVCHAKNIGAKEFALGFEQLTPSLKGLSPSMN